VPLEELRRRFGLAAGAEVNPLREAARRFPIRWTRYYLDLTDPRDPADPIRRIAFPAPTEPEPSPVEIPDPVGERRVSPVPFVVRKHRDRAVLLVTARCHVYCRFCFRRGAGHREPSEQDLARAVDYLRADPELREVILSGGDPLVLPDEALRRLVGRLSESPRLEALQIHSRAPVHDPARVTPALAAALSSGLPARMVLHYDHPREVTEETRRVVSTFLAAGLPLLNQSVLLAGVNDDADTLETLCRALYRERIQPYYLHHPDPAPGAGAFHLEPERGLALYRELERRLGGGPALPRYVIDPPDGSGKVPVERYLRR
jgi:lysine 2,3-aminomutase